MPRAMAGRVELYGSREWAAWILGAEPSSRSSIGTASAAEVALAVAAGPRETPSRSGGMRD